MVTSSPADPSGDTRLVDALLPHVEEIRRQVAGLLRSRLPVTIENCVPAVEELLARAGAIASTFWPEGAECAGIVAGLSAVWRQACDAVPGTADGRRLLETMLRDLDAAIEGWREERRPRRTGTSWIQLTRDHRGFAVTQMAACLAGAVLTLWHWWSTDWAVRQEELAGVNRTLPAEVAAGFATPMDHLVPVVSLLLLATGGVLGAIVFAGALGKRLACAAGWTLVMLVPLHAVEGWLVQQASGPNPGTYRLWLQAVSFAGYALLPAAGIVSVLAVVTATARMIATHVYRRRLEDRGIDPLLPAWRSAAPRPGDDAHWYAGTALPSRRPGGLGICLSGGGIRSATFALGALQALQESGSADPGRACELSRARYLAVVSGGAYTAGAFQLALHPQPQTSAVPDRPPVDQPRGENLFRPGSPEFDYLRQHSAYIADGFREWAVAILVAVRGALFSMLFLAAVVLVAGRWVGLLYRKAGRSSDLVDPWQPIWGAVWATAIVAGVAIAMWLVSIVITAEISRHPRRRVAREWLRRGAVLTCIPLAVLVVLGAVVPVVTRVSWAVVEYVTRPPAQEAKLAWGAASGGTVAAAGVAMTVFGLLYRRSLDVAKAARSLAEGTRKIRQRLGDTGKRAMQWLAVYAGLSLVAAVYLVVFGFSTYTTAHASTGNHPKVVWGAPDWTLPVSNEALTFVLTGALVALYLVLDETSIGLHPFYRQRLAKAFAVRRVRRPWRPGEAPAYLAKAYDWDEGTDLETYGATPEGAGFPQVIFCAAAHCNERGQTPPGRHVLPFTFSSDAVGGPQLGWYRPGSLRPLLPQRLRGDLTVQTAMAVSGAAFASATGTFQDAANLVLGLTNARLGVWYANPAAFRDRGRQWWWPRPPKIRRMSYYLREIAAWYPRSNPLLFVSDGGRYDNLGLVELLRHRCREIYCFDATSDEETFARSVARSIALAWDELGVQVELDDPERIRPSTAKVGGAADDLAGRVAARSVLTGKINYPAVGPGAESATGILVIGRAVLDEDTPWEVCRHAAAHPSFPHDATGDQWFDDTKFDAYTMLGRHVGRAARLAMASRRSAPPRTEGRRPGQHPVAPHQRPLTGS